MAGTLSPRQLIFYIRAENQASRVFRAATGDFKNMTRTVDLKRKLELFDQKALLSNAQMINNIAQGTIAAESATLRLARAQNKLVTTNVLAKGAAPLKPGEKLTNVPAIGGAGMMVRGPKGFTRAVQVEKVMPGLTVEQTAAQMAIYEKSVALANERVVQLNKAAALNDQYLAMQAEQLRRVNALAPWENYERWANSVRHVGAQLQLLGIISTAAIGYAANAAKNLSTNLMLAATQARPIGAGVTSTVRIQRNLMEETLGLMQKYPASAQEMGDAYYKIFSGTNIQNTKLATRYLGLFNQMAVAGGTDLSTMADIGVVLINQFAPTFKEAERYADAFFAAVRYGNVNAQQLATSLTKVVPIAKAARLSFYDIADALAFLSRMSTPQQLSGTATGLTRLIETLGRADVARGLRSFGVEIENVRTGRMRPLLNIIGDIKHEIIDTGKIRPGPELLNFFKTVTAAGGGSGTALGAFLNARKALAFLITNYEQYAVVSGKVNADIGELAASFKAMSKTPGVQWGVFTNQIKVFAYTIGNAAIPALVSMFGWIGNLTRWFNNLSDGTRQLVGRLLAFSSVGLLLTGTLIKMGAGMAQLYIVFTMWQIQSGRVVSSQLAIARAATLLRTALLATTIAMIAFAAAFIVFPGVGKAITNAMGGVDKAFGIITSGFLVFSILKVVSALTLFGRSLSMSSPVMIAITAAVMLAVYLIENWGKVRKYWVVTWNLMVNIVKMAFHVIKAAIELAVYDALLVFLLLAKGIKKIFGWVPWLGDKIKSGMNAAIKFISGFKDRAIEDFNAVGDAWNNITFDTANPNKIYMWAEIMRKQQGPEWPARYAQALKTLAYSNNAYFQNAISQLQEQAKAGSETAKQILKLVDAMGLLGTEMDQVPKPLWNYQDIAKGVWAQIKAASLQSDKFTSGLKRLGALYVKLQSTDPVNVKAWLAAKEAYDTYRTALETGATAAQKALIDPFEEAYAKLHQAHWSDAQFQMQLAKLVTLYHRKELTKRISDIRAYNNLRAIIDKNTDDAQQEAIGNALQDQQKAWISQAAFFKLVQQAQAAEAVMNAAKTQGAWYAAAKNYQTLMSRVQDMLNSEQMSMFSDAVNNQKKAGIPMAQFWKRLAQVQILAQKYAAVEGTKEGYSVYLKYQKALTALQKDSSEDQWSFAQDYFNKVNVSFKDVLNNAKQMYDEFDQTNQQMLQLFQGPFAQGPVGQIFSQYNIGWSGEDIIEDITGQVGNIDTWMKYLQRLKGRKIPQTLFEQIIKMNPNDPMVLANIKELTEMSQPEWNKLVKSWNAGQDKIMKLNRWELVKYYKSLGKKMGEAVLKGMESAGMPDKLKKMLRTTILELFPGLAKLAGAGIPKTPTVPKTNPPNPARTTQSTTIVTYNNNHAPVITVKQDDVLATKTALNHSYFTYRATRGG